MSLKLINFKCWKDKTIDLNYNTILIEGKSGKGKSTVLNAILYVLYGKIKKPCTFGEKSCSVEFRFKDISIKRTSNPKTLSVSHLNKIYRNEEAQHIIDRFFLSQNKFINSSIIKQKSNCSIISLSPIEQLSLIEELCFDNSLNFKDIKHRINNCIKEYTKSEETIKIKKEWCEAQYKKNNFKVNEELENFLWPDEDVNNTLQKLHLELEELNNKKSGRIFNDTHDVLVRLIAESKNKNNELLALYKKLDQVVIDDEFDDEYITDLLNYDVYNNIYKEYKGYKKTFYQEEKKFNDEYQKEIESVKNNIKNLEYEKCLEILKYPIFKVSKEEAIKYTEETIKKLKDKYKFRARLVKTALPSIKKIYKKLDEEIKESEEQFTKLRRYLEQEEILSKKYTCPKCETKLIILDNELVDSDTTKSIEEIYKEFEMCKKILSTKRKDYNELSEVIEKLEEYEKIINTKNTATFKDVMDCKTAINKYELLNKQLSDLESVKIPNYLKSVESKYDTFYQVYQSIKPQYKELKNKFDNVDVDLEYNKYITYKKNIQEKNYLIEEIKLLKENIETLEKKIKALSEKESDVKSEIKNQELINKRIESIKDNIIYYTKLLNQINKYNTYQKEKEFHASLLKSCEESKKEHEIELIKLEKAIAFKKIFIESQIHALSEMINCINKTAKYYLDNIFNEDIQVLLKYVKEDNKKLKLSIYVYVKLKGVEYDSIKDLSGGECDRVNLAFILALNEVMQSKMLFLDESLSSLDSKTKENVLELIKTRMFNETTNKKLMVISHNIEPTLFDYVIKI